MSQINVDSIANTNDDGPVYFPRGMRGDATNLQYEPKILTFDPVPLSTGISTTTNITITFDQQIQFSGVGTIYIREGSPTGSITTSFTCGVSTEATIAGETLVINPLEPVGINTTNYVILPSVGIANTFGAYYKGTESYFFKTLKPGDLFSATGGTHEFTLASAPSPTGYYKYHIFTSSGPLVTTASSVDADDFKALIVGGGGAGGQMYLQPSSSLRYGGGGGGAGGRIYQTGPEMSLATGTYTVTIGAGGIGTTGNDTTIATPTSTIITAYGGGFGASATVPTGLYASGGSGGSGGGGGGYSNPPTGSGGSTGGTGVPGQGNPGGNLPGVNLVSNPTNTATGTVGAGGGGAGGNGGNGFTSGPTPPVTGTSSQYRGPGAAGPGGAGAPSPEFSSPILAPQVPTIPSESFAKIGSTGLYAGGGGGAGIYPPAYNINPPQPYPSGNITRGTGGPGGGGAGVYYPSPAISTDGAEPGFANTGGGGGGGGNPSSNQPIPSPAAQLAGNSASGGSGVVMIRYAVPAP